MSRFDRSAIRRRVQPHWTRTPSTRKGLRKQAIDLLNGGALPDGQPGVAGLIGAQLLHYLDNAWRGQPLNGGKGRGNPARFQRAARRLQVARARAPKRRVR